MRTQKSKARKSNATAAEKALKAGNEAAETVVKAGAEVAAQNVEKAVKVTKDQVEKANVKAFRTIDEVFAFNKENIDAAIKAGNAYLKGLEAINNELVAYTQKSVETGLANAKVLMTAKSLNEAVELHAGYAKTAYDDIVAETAKISEMTAQVANDAAQPISSRFRATVDTIAKSAA